tara:strand:- start:475 stop:807 length:333 start_codon:yes stop_codon:yes gene_type:complete
MAFTPYHNIVGDTAQDNELVAINDISKKTIKSIQITNIGAAATIDLYIFKDSTDAVADKTYYFLKEVSIPANVSLILDNTYLLNFDNTSTGYSLHIHVAAADVVDVIIKT